MLTRILLLYICAFYFSSCIKHRMDLDQCGKTTDCFVPTSCTKNLATNEKDELINIQDSGKITSGNCEAVLQIRHITKAKFLVMMQVKSTQSIATTGVFFKHKVNQFGCSKTGPIGDDVFEIFDKFSPDIEYGENLVFCSLILKIKDNKPAVFRFADPKYASEKPAFEYALGTISKSIKYKEAGAKIWKKVTEKCSPETIESLEVSDELILRDQVDRYALPTISCASPKSLIISRSSETIDLGSDGKLTCDKTLVWAYNSVKIPKAEAFKIACEVKFCSLCKPLLPLSCPGCSSTSKGSSVSGGCVTESCPNNEWMLPGVKPVTGEMECSKDKEDANSKNAFWYRKDDTAAGKITKAACFSKEVCWKESNLKECPADKECLAIVHTASHNQLSCPEGLQISHSHSSGNVILSSKISCDFASGSYKDDNGVVVEKGANVYCEKKNEKKPAAAATSDFPMEYVVAGGVGFLVLIGIGIFVFLCVMRRRKAEEKRKKLPRTVQLTSIETPSRKAENDSNKSVVVASVVEPPTLKPPPPPVPNNLLPKLPGPPKTSWLNRERNRPVVALGEGWKEKIWTAFSEDAMAAELLPSISAYSPADRRKVFKKLNSFEYYEEKLENKRPYGHLRQFFDLLRHIEATQMDDVAVWESIYRFFRTLEHMIRVRLPTDTLSLAGRLKPILPKIVRPIYTELGLKMKPDEDATTTMMRFFVVRVLVWAGEADVMHELSKLSSTPIDQLESPLRAIVFQYSARYLNKGEEMMREHWKVVMDDPKDAARDKFGTMRQHLLFGLSAARDERAAPVMDQEYRILKTVITALYADLMKGKTVSEKSFVPIDWHWAYFGAIEYHPRETFEFANVAAYAFEMDDPMDELFKSRNGGKGAHEVPVVRKQWERTMTDTTEMCHESCVNVKQTGAVGAAIGHLEWSLICNGEEGDSIHDQKYYRSRMANMETFFKDKKVANIIDEALKRIGN